MNVSKATGTKCSLVLAMSFVTGIALAHNIIPNPGFEDGTVIPDGDCVVNEGSTAGWKGGILTCGDKKTFCFPWMYEGYYGMALHEAYPVASNRFTAAVGGTYDFSFHYVSREGKEGMTVAVYLDGSETEIARVCPTSSRQWETFRGTVDVSAGEHEIRLVGTLNPGVTDASTTVDLICLDIRGKNIVPNHSFENGTKISNEQGSYNDPAQPVTFDWTGGMIVPGNVPRCRPKMADGMYGLTLDHTYAEASCRVSAPSTGLYQLSFRCLQANDKSGAATPVSAYIDDASAPVVTVTPNSVWRWLDCHATVALTAGEHTLKLAVPAAGDANDRATTIDFVSLVCQGSNIVPNPSFEDGPTCSDLDVTDSASPWKGGIVTQGGSGKSMCKTAMSDGTYGMALHEVYPSTSTEIQVPQDGQYLLSFKYVSRFSQCAMAARVVFDGAETAPVLVVRPTSTAIWSEASVLVQMNAGTHTLTFFGDLDKSILADDSVVIDDIRMVLQPMGVLQRSDLPLALQTEDARVDSFVDENDVLSLKAPRKFDAGNVYVATGAVVRATGGEYRTAGETCCVTQDASVVTVDWQYAVVATSATNLIPNPGFEKDTVLPSVGYVANDPASPATADWQGGIITRRWTTFCASDTYEGSYALALHQAYPSACVEFDAPQGKYDFSFAILARDDTERTGKMSVSVYVDDVLQMTVVSDSPAYWREHVSTVRIARSGRHTLRFVGTTDVDSSVNIDGIVLRALPQKGLVVVLR